jgi:hypothetical protein
MKIKETTFWSLVILYPLFLVVSISVLDACSDPPKSVKNRVPTMPVQPQPLPVPTPATTANTKEDRQQQTNFGRIVSAGEEHQNLPNSMGWYLSFTFEEEGGFQKKFFPVCDGQMLFTDHSPVAIMYHWHEWQDGSEARQIGCYAIDGWQLHK